MISLKHINKSYNNVPVISDYSRDFTEDIEFIRGESGTGKTTLLNIIMGLLKADSGEILGNDITFSAVFQEDRLLEHLDALNNLKFILGSNYDEKTCIRALEEVGLNEPRKKVKEYSGGMKRRLSIIRALLSKSDAILMDEPFSGLDKENIERAFLTIKKYRNNRQVIIVSHLEIGEESYG